MSELSSSQQSYTPLKATQLVAHIGQQTIAFDTEPDSTRIQLPEGYGYVNPQEFKPDEITRLVRQVDIGKNIPNTFIYDRDYWAELNGFTPIDVGVADANNDLVGFGSLMFKKSYGELDNFVVSPQHQGIGIGKAILLERLRIADDMGITTIRIRQVEYSNTLKSYYFELGFHEVGDRELSRGPFPTSETQPLFGILE